MITTTDGEALLAAIVADPADDLPRLAYADWLEEDGESERAEFVRLQLRLSRFAHAEAVIAGDYDARDGVSMEWREAFLLRDRVMRLLWAARPDGGPNWHRWCWAEAREPDGRPARASGRGGMLVTPHGSPDLRGDAMSCTVPTDAGQIGQSFRRGFVGRVRCPLAAWLAHGPDLALAHPITRVECPGVVRGAIIFRGAGDGDVPPDLWHDLGLIYRACLGRCPDGTPSRQRGTHAHFAGQEEASAWLSASLIAWARTQP